MDESGRAEQRQSRDSQRTSTSLLQLIRAGDCEAWHRLVDLYGPLVYDWCRRSGVCEEDAADVAQEVFASVHANIGGFRRDRPSDSFRGWLWRITRNKIRDLFRRRQIDVAGCGGTDAQVRLAETPAELDDSISEEPGPDEGNRLEHRALELIRATVEDRTWRAFWAVTIEGRPAAEVAAELGMTAGAVYEAKYRVLRRLRDELGDLTD